MAMIFSISVNIILSLGHLFELHSWIFGYLKRIALGKIYITSVQFYERSIIWLKISLIQVQEVSRQFWCSNEFYRVDF